MSDGLTEPYFAISESRLKEILRLLRLNHNYINYADVSEQVIRANPVPNNNPVPNSKELILLAQTDWHNREERKHKYEMIPWTMGWMTGFFSERKPYWPKVHEAAIRRDERNATIKIVAGIINARISELNSAEKTKARVMGTTYSLQDIEIAELEMALMNVRSATSSQEPPHGP